jgi:hypothetical protein
MIIIYNNLDFHRRACVPLELKKLQMKNILDLKLLMGLEHKKASKWNLLL